ncbi:hypothetical protein BsWGS_17167 [Bradybaena similaris]
MAPEKKGHGSSTTHGHGHKAGRPTEPASKKQGKGQVGIIKQNKNKQVGIPEGKQERNSNTVIAATENETMAKAAENKTVQVPPNNTFEKQKEMNDQEKDKEKTIEQDTRRMESKDAGAQNERTEYRKCNITPENFNVKEFNTNMTEFIRTLEDPRYGQVDAEYPIEDLVSLVAMVTKSVSHYKVHSTDSQRQLEGLRDTMRSMKENLHFSVTRQALNLRSDEEHQSQEERELHARLTQLNAALAHANADVTDAIRLATETEVTAVKANIAAEQAKAEAKRIQDEAEKKDKAERRRKEEEKKRVEAERRKKEQEERKIEEEKQRIEEEWKRMEAIQAGKTGQVYESWPPVEYEYTNEHGEPEITCIARGPPGSFDKRDVICKVANEKEALVTYLPNEELVSNVVDLTAGDGKVELTNPIYVAIPHVLSRSGAQSREPVVKAMVDGEWRDLPTKEVTFEHYKDTKFSQAEVRHLTTLIVMSRLKRDYVTLAPNKWHKVTSSFDQRITLSMEKNTFARPEHFLLQVQPVDSGTFQEFRSRQAEGKRLLNCSPVVFSQWESLSFGQPMEVTVPCPPNPAKAKKMALARKLKDDKMKNPPKKPVPYEELEKEKERERQRKQEYTESEAEPARVTKWYMGEYGNSDDDEADNLHLVYMLGGKWFLDNQKAIKQLKVDVLSFRLEFPVERFMILRTRVNVSDESVVSIAVALNEFLGKRFVEAVVRQKSDNPLQVALQVAPVSRLEAVMKQLAQKGFESGPAPSHVLCLQEGDIIEVGFSGNIECTDEIPDQLFYKSNIPTVTYFIVKEENKFRQKEQDVYSGLIHLTRRYTVTSARGKKLQGQTQGQGEDPSQQLIPREWKREQLCTIQINIPKYHIEPNTEPKKAPIAINNTSGSVDQELLLALAASMGDEWKRVAHYLGVQRARVQAIMRNVAVGERSEMEAKYDMLVTWLKGAAKALDKVTALSTALMYSDRSDLADAVQDRNRDFGDLKQQHLTVAN